ncbi:hypothetical protein [Microbispora catharanthi]|uniref:Uncharacterized protein n=1 Tax=Microbispora catharanthi TaxID=1712871 RepID=A0A5N6BZC3_9ACTN|nr:hypothetical protein [Microbispora catharanthi]KAB8185838.1 hypothetical protein FH610_008635 [Microbispora catharanthi]
MNFEERLLMELKAEMATRATQEPIRRPRGIMTRARILAVAGITAAAVAVPLTLGGGAAAYAVVKNPDGTLIVTVKELQDPEGLQAELNAQGIRADVTYTPRDKKCAPGRFIGADYGYVSPNPKNMTAEQLEEFNRPEHWRSRDVTRPITRDKFMISPKLMQPGETLVLEFRLGNAPGVGWSLGTYLAKPGSPVRPCALVDEGGTDAEQAREMAGS